MRHGHNGLAVCDLLVVIFLELDLVLFTSAAVKEPQTEHDSDEGDDDGEADDYVHPCPGLERLVCCLSANAGLIL